MTRGLKIACWALLAWFVASRLLVHATARSLVFGVSFALFVAAIALDVRRVPEETKRTRALRSLATLSLALVVLIDAAHSVWMRGVFSPWLRLSLAAVAVVALVTRLSWEGARRTHTADPRLLERHITRALGFGGVLALVAAINLAVFQHDLKTDVSFSPATRPSAQVAAQLRKLREPLEVVLFLDPSDALWPAVQPYFEAFAALSPQISVRVTEVSREPALVREHRVRGNGWGLLRLASRAEAFEVGRDLAHARTTLKMLDAHVANHLSALLVEARRVYLTRGHGERSLLGDVEESRGRRLADFERLLARFNLRIASLGVAEGLGKEVPADAALVLVLGAERAFLPEEAAALDRYVAGGGHLWLALEPSLDVGLSALLARVGITVLPGVVLCRESHLIRNRTDADRELIVARDLRTHSVTRLAQRVGKRDGVVFVRAAGLRIERAERSAVATALASAAEDCFADIDGDFQQGEHEADTTATLAAAWEDGQGGKVFVIGDGDLPTDQVLRNDANTFLTMGALSWLVGGDVVNVPVFPEQEMPIVHERSEDRLFFYATTFAMPALLFGVAFVTARRRTRKAPSSTRNL